MDLSVIDNLRQRTSYATTPLTDEDRAFLEGLKLPAEIITFYEEHGPEDYVSVKGVNLLPMSFIRDECDESMNGIGLFNAGFMPLASTSDGSLYFVGQRADGFYIGAASTDEADEDTEASDIVEMTQEGAFATFAEFLERFTNAGLREQQ